MFSKATIIAAAAFFANAASAHMIMAKPAPFGKPDNSPLSPGGADYPCKLPQANGFKGNVQNMASGSQQTLAFSGTAVHGGGSCQVSLTKDGAPSSGSVFKVIHSYHGGCPGADGSAASFNFQMPPEVPNGDYVLAWSWFNRIGNREMYMNCAPVKVTGSSGSDSSFGGLPDMAKYNIKVGSADTCKTVESFDVQFPNPGKYVTTGGDFKAKAPVGSNCGASAPSSGSGASAPAPASPPSGSAGSSSGSGTGSANNGQYTGTGSSNSGNSGAGTFGEGASAPAPAAASQPPVASAPSQAASAPTQAASSGNSGAATTSSTDSSGSSAGTVATPGGSCPQDGAVVCSADGTQFGLCNWGKVVMMPVAAGTKCTNGQIRRRAVFRA